MRWWRGSRHICDFCYDPYLRLSFPIIHGKFCKLLCTMTPMPGIGFQYDIYRRRWTVLVLRHHCIAIHVFLSYLLVKSSMCCIFHIPRPGTLHCMCL